MKKAADDKAFIRGFWLGFLILAVAAFTVLGVLA